MRDYLQLSKLAVTVIVMLFSMNSMNAQATFNTVYTLLQTNCATSGCHDGSDAALWDASGSQSDVYDALVGVNPSNAVAASKGNKLVDPGHPYNSFIIKKLGGGNFDSYITLDATEGDLMPKGKAELADHEIELVRQWILAGAQETGNVVDYQLIKDFYANGGLPMIPAPTPPPAGEGMQVRYGPLFFAPGDEREMMKLEHLNNAADIKVYRMDGFMSWQSHHMLLFKQDGSGTREGTRSVPIQAQPFNNGQLTGAWQDDAEVELPARTAFYWEPNTVLDFDYHVKNYSTTEILPSDFYLNIYWDNGSTRDIEMHAQLVNEFILALPMGVQTETRTHNFSSDRYIWMMTSHTHKFGSDYDIYMREPDGSRGTQLYEGFFNQDYTFNQGFYDWEHPATRVFEPLQLVSNGLEFETEWNVTGPCNSFIPGICVTFGLTTDDEMMLFTYLYTKEPVPNAPAIAGDIDGNGTIDSNEIAGDANGNGVIDGNEITGDLNGNGVIDGNEVLGDANGNGVLDPGEVTGMDDINANIEISIVPNPSNGVFTLEVFSSDPHAMELSVLNILGEKLISRPVEHPIQQTFDLSAYGPGTYFVQINSENINQVKKVVIY